MAVQVISLVNYAITLVNPAYTLKPFENKIFTGISAITSDLAVHDLMKRLQAEVITPLDLDDGGGQAVVTAETAAKADALVSGGGILYADVATQQGATAGERRTLSDGPDAGAELIWAIPEGSASYAWCWAIYPLASYL